MDRRGASLLVGLVVLGGAMATLMALMTRVDHQTIRITVLKRSVQALAVANEQLDALKREFLRTGTPPATAALARSFGQASARVGPTSPAARSHLATVWGASEGSGVLLVATLRLQAGRVLVENKRVAYGSAAADTEGARKALFDRLESGFRELRKGLGEEADFRRQGRLDQAYEPALRAAGLTDEELKDVLAELSR
ncbi:MAG: hypothetical protein HY816_04040 [Candidatus Wallbacteria bacterium]|nr:hypothetical protein [Candidatus Wallbacteria bacterium]